MDSPRSGSRNEPTILLQIESPLFDLYIEGRPTHPTVEEFRLHHDEAGQLIHANLQVVAPSTHVQLQHDQIRVYSRATEQLEPYYPQNIYPCFYEHQTYELVIEKKNIDAAAQLEFYHDNYNLRKAIKPKGKTLLTGNLNFQNEVGFTEFELRLDGETVLRVALEIFPSKIDYRRDYQNLIQEVNEQVYNLSFDFLRKTYSLMGLTEDKKPDQSLTEFFSILKTISRRLVQAVEQIHKTPHHRLAKENRVVDADRVKRAGRENIAYLAKRPHLMREDNVHGMIHANGKMYRPTQVLETRRRMEYDTAENRFLRWALLRIEGRLKEMRKRLLDKQKRWQPDLDKNTIQAQLEQVEGMRGQFLRLLRLDFLQEVGEMKELSVTLVLQMAPGYRDVYRFYLLLLKGLTLQDDLFRLSMKDVAQLYEYWCFLKIHDLLQSKYELKRQDIVRVVHGGLFVRLDKSHRASVTYCNPQNGEEFTLMYNSKEDSATVGQEPDNVLSLVKRGRSGVEVTYNYVFDAKYKLNSTVAYRNRYGTPGPQEEDINTMHRYRDAIVSQVGETDRYERTMFGAYVLFPYQEQNGDFVRNHFYKSIQRVNVGALPFLPGSTRLVERFLDELIGDSSEEAFERAVPTRGTKQYFESSYRDNDE